MWGTGSNPGLRGNPSDIEILAKAANLVSRPFKRKSSHKYSARRSRISRGVTQHKYVRRCQPISITLNQLSGIAKINNAAVATPTFGIGFGFALDNVILHTGGAATPIGNTYTDLTALYDQYRIDRIAIDFLWNNNDVYPGNSYTLPVLQTAVDHTDIIGPTTNQQLTQYSSFKLQQLGTKSRFRAAFRPCLIESTATGNVGGTTGQICRKATYLSTDTVGCSHTGYKIFWDVPAGAQTNIGDGIIQIYVTYYMTLKMVK